MESINLISENIALLAGISQQQDLQHGIQVASTTSILGKAVDETRPCETGNKYLSSLVSDGINSTRL